LTSQRFPPKEQGFRNLPKLPEQRELGQQNVIRRRIAPVQPRPLEGGATDETELRVTENEVPHKPSEPVVRRVIPEVKGVVVMANEVAVLVDDVSL
jgi:hypothetical protein